VPSASSRSRSTSRPRESEPRRRLRSASSRRSSTFPIILIALSLTLVDDVGIDLMPREVEAILPGMVIVIGVHLAFLALTESSDTAGA